MTKKAWNDEGNLPQSSKTEKIARGALQVAGLIPKIGGIFSAIAGAWSEHEQEEVNKLISLLT